MPPLPRSILAIFLAFIAGCAAVGPDYQSVPPRIPTGWTETKGTGLRVTEQAPDNLAQWWRQWNDPILSELIAQAMDQNSDLRTARARLREARASRAVADSARYPSVTASGSASRSKGSKETTSGATRDAYSAGIDAAWEPDLFGATRRDIEAAQADLDAAGADLHATQVSLVAEVALNYVNLRAYLDRLAIARANLSSQSETLQLTEWRTQAGLASSLDVEQARANRAQTLAQIPSLESSLAQTEHNLALLLGQAPASLHAKLAQAGPIPTVPDLVKVGIPAQTLAQRPDVAAAERRLAAATARIGVAEAARYPGLSLSASLSLESLSLDHLVRTSALSNALVASLAGPIFNAGRLRQQVEIQNARQEQALISYEKTVLTALQEVEDALTALANNRQRQAALRVAADSSRNAALLARQRYSSGIVDFQTVLDAERSQLSAEDSLKSSEAEGATSLIQLYKALGGGWSPDSPNSSPSAANRTPS